MYKQSEYRDAATFPKTTMVNLATDASVAAINNYNINKHNNTNKNNNSNKIINNVIDSSNCNINNSNLKSNQINENRNQIGNVENYRPTYGAYINNILPRGPYLQYKFNDQQQSKKLPNEFDNNEHSNESQTNPSLITITTTTTQTHHPPQKQQQQLHHHQYETASKDFRSLPYVVSGNPTIGNNPLSNYQLHHQSSQHHNTRLVNGTNTVGSIQANRNISVADARSRQPQVIHRPATRTGNFINPQTNETTVPAAANGILQSFNCAPMPTYSIASNGNTNCHQIRAMNATCDRIHPVRGYQTLPHKLKTGQGGYSAEVDIDTDRLLDIRGGDSGHHQLVSRGCHQDSKSNPMNARLQTNGDSYFLHQIKLKNSNMLARMTAGLTKNCGQAATLPHSEIRHPLAGMRGEIMQSTGRSGNGSSNQINAVTLADLVRLKSSGLRDYEGWALLCQAVQALQDLFLTDTPSTLRILPLVRPSTVQITSRGRVVFIVTSSLGQLEKFNETSAASTSSSVTPSSSLPAWSTNQDIISNLAPEFVSALDNKKMAFAESDIEKMWIYSLGITLRKTIAGQQRDNTAAPYSTVASIPTYDNSPRPEAAINSENMSIAPTSLSVPRCTYQNHYNNVASLGNSGGVGGGINHIIPAGNKNTINNYHNLDISLDQVIGSMCERNLHQRASLMYLLDVISTFCRNQQQVKPFSHIVMELFNEIASIPERDCDEPLKPILKTSITSMDGSRSETDSGRSSAHGEKDIDCSNGQYDCQNQEYRIGEIDLDRISKQNLRVIRNRPTEIAEYQKFGAIGYAGVKSLLMQKKQIAKAPALQVVRRTKEGILKRKNSFRRNTIDINLYDLEKARQETFYAEIKTEVNTSKSTNCIDKIGSNSNGQEPKIKDERKLRVEGLSMPDLNVHKITTLPNFKTKCNRIKSFDALTKAYSEDSFWIKSSGPEFIVKSSLPSRAIDLVDPTCQHRRIVSVLLLNGESLHISCNSLSTTAQQIFEAVIRSENYIENFFIGLCALIGGDFVFLPGDLKIYKVAPQIWVNISKKTNNIDNVFFTLFLRIKFFLPTLRGISSLESRHMLYLQLRKSVLEKHILCTDDDLITLGGLALQSEVGNFKESMKYSEYFTISHYLPEGVYQRNKEMAKYLRNSHYCRQGLHSSEAEQNFIKYIQDMKDYGFHLYSAVWTTDNAALVDVYVGISLGGIALFERLRQPQANPLTNSKTSYQRKLYISFEWLEIENLCFSKHILCIVVRKTESLKAKDNNRIKYKLKMDGRKSYFAFSLASEHHQFYMKLRNSFISLKTLSDKLNIPIASSTTTKKTMATTTITAKDTIVNEEEKFKGIESTDKCKRDYDNDHRREAIQQQVKIRGDEQPNKKSHSNGRETAAKPSSGGGIIGSGIHENIKKIDKQLKASGLRVRNLKKSMLNDNRLIKLKQRFLRRSKSSVGSCSGTTTNDDERKSQRKNDFPQYKDNSNHGNEDSNGNCGGSKEENQNKENECPKVQSNDLEPKIYSPNRNRVKMGTRVFSTQFLNKSYDNIYDRALNLYRFESASSINNAEAMDNSLELLRLKGPMTLPRNGDNEISMKSASLNSLLGLDKPLNCHYRDSPIGTDAYVIHSSFQSERELHASNNNFNLLPNETVSESLLEKFNNISGNNTVTDRIIAKLTVVKERLNKPPPPPHTHHQQSNHPQYFQQHNVRLNERNDLICYDNENETAASLQQNAPIKYATFNPKMAKEYPVNNRNSQVASNNVYINNANSNYSKTLWHLSRSQESIFLNNKFPMRNESMLAVNHHNSNKTVGTELNEFTLGISIVQGSDNNVYVKDLVKNGPAEKNGIRIGDQIIAVNGKSLLNLSYAESLRLLQNTGRVVELQVSQIFSKNVNFRRPSYCKSQRDDGDNDKFRSNSNDIVVGLKAADDANKYANTEPRMLNGMLTNHCDEYLKCLETIGKGERRLDEDYVDAFLFRNNANNIRNTHQAALVAGRRLPSISSSDSNGGRSIKRIGSFEIASDNIRPTWDKFKSPRNVNGNLCVLSPAKSMPDLPKVVAIIHKSGDQSDDANPRKPVVRSASQSRKYLGPMRYPVTPIKTVLSPIRHQLSLLADSDDEQACFRTSTFHSLVIQRFPICYPVA